MNETRRHFKLRIFKVIYLQALQNNFTSEV